MGRWRHQQDGAEGYQPESYGVSGFDVTGSLSLKTK
jgi:hypothetical protein